MPTYNSILKVAMVSVNTDFILDKCKTEYFENKSFPVLKVCSLCKR